MTGMKHIAFALVMVLCSLSSTKAQSSTVPDGGNRAVSAAAPQVPVNLSGASDGAIVTVTNTGAPTGGGVGVSGNAPVGYGVQGSGLIGVNGMGGSTGIGVSGSSSGQGTGVVGQSNSGMGVTGTSITGKGVYGTGGDSGLYGVGTGPTSNGVFGTSVDGNGVYGESTSRTKTDSTGVSGRAFSGNAVYGRSDTGVGVYGRANATGYAGFFEGKIEIRGEAAILGNVTARNLTVSGCTGCNNPPSDRNLKANFSTINARSILTRLAAIPIQSWNYKSESETIRHIGPMAQDFRAAFGLGESDKTLNTVDVNGVTMAAIQGLYQMVQEKDRQIEQLQNSLRQLERRVSRRAKVRGRMKR